MTTFYLIRHGEPSYQSVDDKKFIGHGRDLASLTINGIEGVKETSKDNRLKDCEIIVSSPYTRALQTAAILSKELNIDIEVDIDLHEWIPDLSFQYKTSQESFDLGHDFDLHNGTYPENEIKLWETAESMTKRMKSVIEKYKKYNKVIIVSHGMLMRTVKYQEKIKHAEIVEYTV